MTNVWLTHFWCVVGMYPAHVQLRAGTAAGGKYLLNVTETHNVTVRRDTFAL